MLEEREIYAKINITGYVFFLFSASFAAVDIAEELTQTQEKIFIYEQRNCPLINNLFAEIFRCVYSGLVRW